MVKNECDLRLPEMLEWMHLRWLERLGRADDERLAELAGRDGDAGDLIRAEIKRRAKLDE